jgi:hypothetical protein
LAHSLRDTVTLAEIAGLGVCIDLYSCWWEADLKRTLAAEPEFYVFKPLAELPASLAWQDGAALSERSFHDSLLSLSSVFFTRLQPANDPEPYVGVAGGRTLHFCYRQ